MKITKINVITGKIENQKKVKNFPDRKILIKQEFENNYSVFDKEYLDFIENINE
jgi:hypothetical protein